MSENSNDLIEVPVQRTDDPEDSGRPSYESAGGDTICASYLTFPQGRDPEQYLTFMLGGDGATNLELQRVTTNYAVYDSENGAITGLYVNLDQFDGEAPEDLGFSLSEATEEDFEQTTDDPEAEAEELFN